MSSIRDEIKAIMVDCYDEDEQMSVWELTFFGDVEVPFRATLLGMPVVVTAFRINNANAVQCQVKREDKQRWVGVDDLDEEGLPTDMLRVLTLCHLARNIVHAVNIPVVS
jgi:hypothetical protein